MAIIIALVNSPRLWRQTTKFISYDPVSKLHATKEKLQIARATETGTKKHLQLCLFCQNAGHATASRMYDRAKKGWVRDKGLGPVEEMYVVMLTFVVSAFRHLLPEVYGLRATLFIERNGTLERVLSIDNHASRSVTPFHPMYQPYFALDSWSPSVAVIAAKQNRVQIISDTHPSHSEHAGLFVHFDHERSIGSMVAIPLSDTKSGNKRVLCIDCNDRNAFTRNMTSYLDVVTRLLETQLMWSEVLDHMILSVPEAADSLPEQIPQPTALREVTPPLDQLPQPAQSDEVPTPEHVLPAAITGAEEMRLYYKKLFERMHPTFYELEPTRN